MREKAIQKREDDFNSKEEERTAKLNLLDK